MHPNFLSVEPNFSTNISEQTGSANSWSTAIYSSGVQLTCTYISEKQEKLVQMSVSGQQLQAGERDDQQAVQA